MQSDTEINYVLVLDGLSANLNNGHKRSLRDIGTLLDKNEINQAARSILQDKLLVPENIFHLQSNFSKQDFLDFYYAHEKRITHSDLLDVYYLKDVQDRKVEYEISHDKEGQNVDITNIFREKIDHIDSQIASQDLSAAKITIQELINLNLSESYQYLFNLLSNKDVMFYNDGQLAKFICAYLANYRQEALMEKVIELHKKRVFSRSESLELLAKLTNIEVRASGWDSKWQNNFADYLDSLGTIRDMIVFGYDKILNYRLNFFETPVDYYGKILSDTRHREHLEANALVDIVETGHPRTLYYLAATFYKKRNELKDPQSWEYYNKIRALTEVDLLVKNSEGAKINFNKETSDKTALLNYVSYWMQQYEDYEWDEKGKRFVNKVELVEQTKNYERLFRRLNSRNDSVAVQAYITLSQGDPEAIGELSQKYKQLLRNYNESLPDLQFQFLEQLALLTDYCRKNNIAYEPTSKISGFLDKIKSELSKSERYKVENQLLAVLELSDITGLEYWTCLHQRDMEVSFSMGRVIDRFYSENWEKVVNDENELRLYLKKASLFEKFGIDGVCNAYLKKINMSDSRMAKYIEHFLNTETDEDVVNRIEVLIQKPGGESHSNIEEFIQSPADFEKRDIRILPAPTRSQLEDLVKRLSETDDKREIKNYLIYLKGNTLVDHVPELFRLIDNTTAISKRKGKTVTLSDAIVTLLEITYNYKFSIAEGESKNNPWKKLWEEDQKNYATWGRDFFSRKITEIQTSDVLSIADLNMLTTSPYFEPGQHKSIVLESLVKVSPKKNVRRLKIGEKLSLESDLKYFEPFDFSHKELDDIPKFFEIMNPEVMLEFLVRKSDAFDPIDRGSFFNNLFRSAWFDNFINQVKEKPDGTTIIRESLENYLNANDYLSEFEEQNTYLHIAQLDNIGLSLEQKLNASFKLKIDEGSKAKIQQNIIATIEYEDIPTVLKFTDRLIETPENTKLSFLNKDFGLPVFDEDEIDKIIEAHGKMSEKEFYEEMLGAFGIDYKTQNGNIDFTKIYHMLQFDIVSPFTGEGGSKRDYCTYGIIKILEKHFETRLGFHEKLNESQTFYAFSSAKRAKSWMKYLVENNYAQIDESIPPSYNFASLED